jgi:hypothetical protein
MARRSSASLRAASKAGSEEAEKAEEAAPESAVAGIDATVAGTRPASPEEVEAQAPDIDAMTKSRAVQRITGTIRETYSACVVFMNLTPRRMPSTLRPGKRRART